ncbi:hypothetical protein PR202_gb11652 [Eleusine coracana subsp. coracana]|uniref:Uncharacterized protein n=1 Tax=Eleusine coracana subsp. coracana TaxID=191504 RepID=A0AAV5EN06_ELECO|nr:hypothetical protein PR202_gb11652 [Eleusine coracana subsp. coracana]
MKKIVFDIPAGTKEFPASAMDSEKINRLVIDGVLQDQQTGGWIESIGQRFSQPPVDQITNLDVYVSNPPLPPTPRKKSPTQPSISKRRKAHIEDSDEEESLAERIARLQGEAKKKTSEKTSTTRQTMNASEKEQARPSESSKTNPVREASDTMDIPRPTSPPSKVSGLKFKRHTRSIGGMSFEEVPTQSSVPKKNQDTPSVKSFRDDIPGSKRSYELLQKKFIEGDENLRWSLAALQKDAEVVTQYAYPEEKPPRCRDLMTRLQGAPGRLKEHARHVAKLAGAQVLAIAKSHIPSIELDVVAEGFVLAAALVPPITVMIVSGWLPSVVTFVVDITTPASFIFVLSQIYSLGIHAPSLAIFVDAASLAITDFARAQIPSRAHLSAPARGFRSRSRPTSRARALLVSHDRISVFSSQKQSYTIAARSSLAAVAARSSLAAAVMYRPPCSHAAAAGQSGSRRDAAAISSPIRQVPQGFQNLEANPFEGAMDFTGLGMTQHPMIPTGFRGRIPQDRFSPDDFVSDDMSPAAPLPTPATDDVDAAVTQDVVGRPDGKKKEKHKLRQRSTIEALDYLVEKMTQADVKN